MKQLKFFGYFTAAVIAVGFSACNNDNGNDDADRTSVDTENTTTTTSTGSYSAQADSFKTNSEAGNYLDAKTGKSIKINVDPETGKRTNAETGEPVWRFVDRRNWGVYGSDSWDTVGAARMENNKLQYRGANDKWMNYDERWKEEDDKMQKEWKTKIEDDEMKMKSGDTKIKMENDDDFKVKTEDGKMKADEDGVKVKPK